ncbi:seminal metalloprotease 1-like [Pararge aegeria]|uniref:seminal metalloprotease 1-like n=1 Tax=Pararge aegeria TaxID=116150 RepID=UPI0019D10C80|nr:seminal metalloprotease 1-like [Pararge aegeria]
MGGVHSSENRLPFRSLGAGMLTTGDGLANLFPLRGMIPPDINPEEYSGKFQGDILLDDPTIVMLRNAYIATDVLWPNNTVVWKFKKNDFDKEQRAAIQEAICLIENKTCIRFRKPEPDEKVYVRITGNTTGCYSMVGYQAERGIHVMNLAPHSPGSGCLRLGTIVHEFMHILGFFHMHSTHDRDDYVRIVEENITPAPTRYRPEHSIASPGIELPTFQFTKALKKFDGLMGQRDYVTDSDWLRINRNYDCPGAWD